VKKDKEGHLIVIKGAIHQKEITIINLYVPNVSAPYFIKHTLKDLKAHIDSNMVVVGEFHMALLQIDRSFTQKINKEILEVNDTIDQMVLTDVWRIFHTTIAQCIFFSAACGTFSKS
jgi:hypothetical protein